MEKLKMESVNLNEQNIEKIGKLFPNVITETKDENGKLKKGINFGLLQQFLSEDLVDGDENYEFTWVGKKQSIIEGNKPIRKTLRPCVEESKNWDTTENLYIEGDNLEVLKLLQNSYLNNIKVMYFDPPYNTGNDFVYRDRFDINKEDYEGELGLYDDDENRLFQNTESNGRFHSDWCSMMYPRLQLSRNLLTEDGVIFISIDDNEVNNLRKICDDIFGESNFVSCFIWKSRQNKDNRNITGVSIDHEYILCYSRNTKTRLLEGEERKTEQYKNPDNDSRGDWASGNMVGLLSEDLRPNCHYDLINPETGINYGRPKMGWRYDKNTMNRLIQENRILWPENPDGRPRRKVFLSEISDVAPATSSIVGENIYTRNGTSDFSTLFENKYFDFPKPIQLIKDLIKQVANNDDIVLDVFSGSSTTAHSVLQLNQEDNGNRRFIMVQLPEKTDEKSQSYKSGYKNICEIGKERIRRAGDKIKNESGLMGQNLDIGFRVLKLDDTNMKDVYYGSGEYSQQMLLGLESNIKEDRTDLDLLYGVMLEWGVPLSLTHKQEKMGGKTVHFVNGSDLVACFDENINETVIRDIAKQKPLRVVFRDSSFSNSPDKINVTEIFKTISPETTIKVL